MGKTKSSAKKSKREKEKVKEDKREPAEIRAEEFRVAAQRETVEAFVVAFILALLFRAFLAEAFVIPTGSMAPTLMGAHKDLICDRCEQPFQCGASRERSGPETQLVVVAGICPNCRHVNPIDLAGESNHATFNGDRILVSKFTYALSDPDRWDVIVFKYPGNPKQNYIKRLVGLPNETLTIRHGDIYRRPTGSTERDEILRKPPKKLLAMRHLVYNTDYQSQVLIDADYPSRWQPWSKDLPGPPSDSWKVERSPDGLTATVDSSGGDQFRWLRYFHRWPDDDQWESAERGGSLAEVDPHSSRAITDFYAYDSYVQVNAGYVYDERPSMRSGTRLERLLNGGYSKGVLNSKYQSAASPSQFGGAAEWGGQDIGNQDLGRDGMHWVGDLVLEADIETSADSNELILELVEAGVQHQCVIDLKTGSVSLRIDDVQPRSFEAVDGAGGSDPTAETSVRAGSRHQLRFSNVDDELMLWVDDKLVTFDRPATFDSRLFRSDVDNHPQFLETHPLDAAPAAVAIRGGKGTIRSLRIDRDQYYIATEDSSDGIFDYDRTKLWQLAGRSVSFGEIQAIFTMPEKWSEFVGWNTRRKVSFELDEDQFFPMGDNSPESLDARCWAGTKVRIPLPRGADLRCMDMVRQVVCSARLAGWKGTCGVLAALVEQSGAVYTKYQTNEVDPITDK